MSHSHLSSRRGRPDHCRQWLHDALCDLPEGAVILALGCEEAFLAPHLLEYASDVTVLDTSGGQIAQLARRFPEISFLPHQPHAPLPFAHDTFDAIWCCDILDRVFDPAAALRDMNRVLAPGGRLLATVPDAGAMRAALQAMRPQDEASANIPRIRSFTRRALARLVREAGFGGIQIAAAGVSRTLRLRARKEPGAACERRTSEARAAVLGFDEEFALTGRPRAA